MLNLKKLSAVFQPLVLGAVSTFVAFLAFSSIVATAADRDQSPIPEVAQPALGEARGRWALAYENDFFVPAGRDQDYTYGLSLSYLRQGEVSPRTHGLLNMFDKVLGVNEGDSSGYGIELGLYGFTPEDTGVIEANPNDRPYASLLYFSTSKERVNLTGQTVLTTQVSLGVLGLDLVGDIQDEFHGAIRSQRPQGWHNQISDGGELTFRYSVSLQSLLYASKGFELRQTKAASIGYLTEANWGISFRAGRLNSTWHQFSPELASYAESSSSARRSANEHFFWGGIAVKARAYNVFLQGQFRSSPVSYENDDLNHLIVEAWAGYTRSFREGYYLSYGLRGHTSEVSRGDGNRQVIWGGVTIGKNLI